nr:S-adenosylmethionine-dependent methyltransferase [Ipomoea batatas]GMD11844.1 S-adenosylmethionine-dependent methyltransferase [Ipomoea batatas]
MTKWWRTVEAAGPRLRSATEAPKNRPETNHTSLLPERLEDANERLLNLAARRAEASFLSTAQLRLFANFFARQSRLLRLRLPYLPNIIPILGASSDIQEYGCDGHEPAATGVRSKASQRLIGTHPSQDVDGGAGSLSGKAMHWFDLPAFYEQAKRLLKKPDGVIAAWCYTLAQVNEAVDALLHNLYFVDLDPYWEPPKKLVDDEYRSIEFPFEAVE